MPGTTESGPYCEDQTKTVHTVECPRCDWSEKVRCFTEELARQVDGEMHWEEEHDGVVPEDADFGGQQCPECLDMRGMDGSVSCSECGHIPPEVRA